MMMMQQSLIQGFDSELKIDRRRNAKYHPGQFVTSVIMDQQALECYYCVYTFPCFCCKQQLAEATYMDIYANGAVIGKPLMCCCLNDAHTSIGQFHHFDDFNIFNSNAVKGEACAPYPFCFVDKCGCCGEALVMSGKCCAAGSFFALGNHFTTCSWMPIVSCCLPISVMYGLAPGEAQRVAGLLNNQMASFRSGQWPTEQRLAAAMGGPKNTLVIQQPVAVAMPGTIVASPVVVAPPVVSSVVVAPPPQQVYVQQ